MYIDSLLGLHFHLVKYRLPTLVFHGAARLIGPPISMRAPVQNMAQSAATLCAVQRLVTDSLSSRKMAFPYAHGNLPKSSLGLLSCLYSTASFDCFLFVILVPAHPTIISILLIRV